MRTSISNRGEKIVYARDWAHRECMEIETEGVEL
jgi:hypothetical protein